jgi:hypothetical protein
VIDPVVLGIDFAGIDAPLAGRRLLEDVTSRGTDLSRMTSKLCRVLREPSVF